MKKIIEIFLRKSENTQIAIVASITAISSTLLSYFICQHYEIPTTQTILFTLSASMCVTGIVLSSMSLIKSILNKKNSNVKEVPKETKLSELQLEFDRQSKQLKDILSELMNISVAIKLKTQRNEDYGKEKKLCEELSLQTTGCAEKMIALTWQIFAAAIEKDTEKVFSRST